jgi:hypothetical protein
MRRLAQVVELAFLFVLVLGHPVSAEDWWGRKLANQPENFLFGYGSLINTASREATAAKPVPAIPVRISASFGFVRAWVDRSATGFTALGLRRPIAGESAMTVNGVLYPVEGADMSLFDRREAGYARVNVPLDLIEAVSWQRVPAQGKVWAYIPIGRDGKIGEDLPVASAAYPLLQSYIDVVLDGALEHGWDFARELVETTQDWSPYWLNDRELPRRPWVFDKNYAEEDQLLRETQPAAGHFEERLLPEVFAVRHGQSLRP